MNTRLLIVDDLALNRRLLEAVLTSEGFEITAACDGVEALAELERDSFVGIISDILMPNMDGYRLCREVRADKRFRELPFLFYTSTYTTAEDEQLALDCGGDCYLRKPAPASEIIKCVRDMLKGASVRAEQAVAPTEGGMMERYNAALIRKLEDKNADLLEARDRLSRLNEELEERIEERTAELREANEELDAFSQSIAHDLRSPLAAVDFLAAMLIEEGRALTEDEWRGHAGEIRTSVKRMNALVNDLLALAKASRGELRRQEVDLSTMATEVARVLAGREPARQVDFHVLAGLRAEADPGLVRIVLENLIGNAFKYTGKQREPRVSVGQLRVGGEEIFYVKDNGAGFEPHEAINLFQPFVRLHGQDEFPGTGIGLTTVRRVITRHGGRVWAEAAVNAGATFYFTLKPLVLDWR